MNFGFWCWVEGIVIINTCSVWLQWKPYNRDSSVEETNCKKLSEIRRLGCGWVGLGCDDAANQGTREVDV